jgi:long-subunit fatty acid transport protein
MFSFAFPLFRNRVSAGFGFRGRYDPDGDFRIEHTTPEGDAYADWYERSGGLWSVPFTLALDAGRFAKLGAFYSLERGHVQDTWIVDFADAAHQDAVSAQDRSVSGDAFGVGASLRPTAKISLGVVYESKIDYDVDVEERYTNDTADTAYAEAGALPERWVVSVCWRVAPKFSVYAGGSVSDFTKFGGFDFPPSRLAREEVAALGLEYKWKQRPIRASVRYEKLPYTLPAGEEITKMVFAIGSGLMFKGGMGKLDAALQFGETGSVDANGFADRSVRFVLSITGSEQWKRKRDSRY